MFRKKKIISEIIKLLDNINEKQIDKIFNNFNKFNESLLKMNSIDNVSKYIITKRIDPINNLFSRITYPDLLVYYESNVDFNNKIFIRKLFDNNNPIYDFDFHNDIFPKQNYCIYTSSQNGTHLLKINNGQVSIPPELLTNKFQLNYISGGRMFGKKHSLTKYTNNPKILNPMLD